MLFLVDIFFYVDKCKIVVCNECGGNIVKIFGNIVNKLGINIVSN